MRRGDRGHVGGGCQQSHERRSGKCFRINPRHESAARCGGRRYFSEGNISSLSDTKYGYLEGAHFDAWRRGIFAHTSPIYVACGGDWWMFDRDTAQYMLTLIEGDLQYIRHNSTLADDGTVSHHHGEEDHIAYLERPFHEAREAVHERMHKLGVSL